MRDFRFGVQLGDQTSRAAWTDRVRQADDRGYDVALTADHLTPDALPPLVGLPLAAAVSDRLRFGTLVCNNDLRHPLVLAHEALAVDRLTDGRLELGVGAGWSKPEYDAAGLPFDEPALRVLRLEESVAALRPLLAGEAAAHDGDHYRIHAELAPPSQRPHVPLLIGGDGPRMLALAGRCADIVGLAGLRARPEGGLLPAGLTPDAVAERVAWVRAAAGDHFETIELNALVQRVVLTDDARAAADDLAERLDGVDADDVLASPFVLIGSTAALADELHRHRETLGLSYFVVFERDAEAFADVIALLR